MSLRTRILAGTVVLFLVPLSLFGVLVSRWMASHFTTQYRLRADAVLAAVGEDLAARKEAATGQLHAFRDVLLEDNALRVYVQTGDPEAGDYVHDLGPRSMRLLGLDLLQIQNEEGEILTCGQRWSMFGTREPQLPPLLSRAGSSWVLLRSSRQEGPFLALVDMDSVRIGAHRLYLIGGTELTQPSLERLAKDPDLRIRLRLPDQAEGMALEEASAAPDSTDGPARDAWPAADHAVTRSLAVPFLHPRGTEMAADTARIFLSYPLADLDEFLAGFRRWLLLMIGALAAGGLALAFWLSRRISGPLVDLARRAAEVDLERLDASFPSARRDEVGVLAGCLDRMMARLRASAQRLREAEHRATLGELARQVNHDIKNGLIPLRNVIRHLMQLLDQEPRAVSVVLSERRGVIDSSISYLEELAANYARISRRPQACSCRLNEVVAGVGASLGPDDSFRVRLDLDPDITEILVDPVAVRRITENLAGNARDSLKDFLAHRSRPSAGPSAGPTAGAPASQAPGEIRLRTRRATSLSGQEGIELAVEDNGPGIPESIRERVFEDFFTTKERGTGLGLSIVRRLVSDFGGTIRAEDVSPTGARFVAFFPWREVGSIADSAAESRERGGLPCP